MVKNKIGWLKSTKRLKIAHVKITKTAPNSTVFVKFIIYLYCVILTNFEHTTIAHSHHQYHLDLPD